MRLQQLLNDLIALELIISDAKDFECLLSGHEAALDAKALLCNLLAALVAELLHCALVLFFLEILEDP